MVFRKESRADSFQRQISALRQQLGTDQEDDEFFDDAEPMPDAPAPVDEGTPVAARPPSSPSPRPSQPRVADASTGVIAADSVWSGTLRAQGSLQIFGEVEGELAANNEIFVAEGARVNARIAAQVIIVAGTVDGTLECSGRLEVLPSGRVSGEVFAPTLVVHEGATVDGDLKMQVAESAG
ncbi:MAG TPA: polymer-forming cytoskeletal protein [Thermomicrobiales bacterium]|nr:polymer-forming cytoskeletal protein [Thermomicrobiales bacterium]